MVTMHSSARGWSATWSAGVCPATWPRLSWPPPARWRSAETCTAAPPVTNKDKNKRK